MPLSWPRPGHRAELRERLGLGRAARGSPRCGFAIPGAAGRSAAGASLLRAALLGTRRCGKEEPSCAEVFVTTTGIGAGGSRESFCGCYTAQVEQGSRNCGCSNALRVILAVVNRCGFCECHHPFGAVCVLKWSCRSKRLCCP